MTAPARKRYTGARAPQTGVNPPAAAPRQAHPPARAGRRLSTRPPRWRPAAAPQQHRQRGQRRVVGDIKVAVARATHVIGTDFGGSSPPHQVIHPAAHVGGYHRVRVRNAVVPGISGSAAP